MKKKLKAFFSVGRHGNRRRLHLLGARSILLLFLFIVFVEFLFLANYVGRISFEELFATVVPEKLVELTNIRREEKEVGELLVNPLLEEAAEKKANDMAEKGYFAHNSPEGLTPWYWFEQVGYNYRHAGENLAVNFTETHKVDEAWMRSPTHRANIINKNFEEIGISTAQGEYKGREATFVVQLFGTRTGQASLSMEEEKETTTLQEQESREIILGEEEVRENGRKEEEEEEDGEERSFAFMQKMGEDRTILTIGHPETTVMLLGERAGYDSFWERVRKAPLFFAGYFSLAITGVLVLAFLFKRMFLKRLKLSLVAANGFIAAFVILSGMLTSHYVLQIFV